MLLSLSLCRGGPGKERVSRATGVAASARARPHREDITLRAAERLAAAPAALPSCSTLDARSGCTHRALHACLRTPDFGMKSKLARDMWVFGYGSLIWKADFPYEKKVIGHIKGYIRRFYQKSTDHRGVPSRPGRVVTLLASNNPADEVWGCAYKIAPENIESVTNHLDYRERGGYERKSVIFHPVSNSQIDEEPFQLYIYIGHEDNPNFAGYENIDTIAEHIAECAGVSGHNTEYLYNLAAAMRTIAPKIYDEHLYELEDAVRRIELLKKKKALEFDQHKQNVKVQ